MLCRVSGSAAPNPSGSKIWTRPRPPYRAPFDGSATPLSRRRRVAEMMSLRVDVASTKPGASTTAGITTVTVLPDLVGPSTYACISNDSQTPT